MEYDVADPESLTQCIVDQIVAQVARQAHRTPELV